MPLKRNRGEIVAPRPYEEMTIEELTHAWTGLLEKRVTLTDGVEQLQLELDAARDRVARFREYADDRWYHATKRDLHHRRARLKALELEIRLVERLRHERLRVAKQEHFRTHMEFHLARDRTQDRAFVRAAKRLLDEATYLEIWRQAQAELSQMDAEPDRPADPGQVGVEDTSEPSNGAK
jgi:hypothetical protein